VIVMSGISVATVAGTSSVPPGQRCAGRHLLGTVVPVRRTQREDTEGDRVWCLSATGWAPHVSHCRLPVTHGWQFGIVVPLFVALKKLLYVEPG